MEEKPMMPSTARGQTYFGSDQCPSHIITVAFQGERAAFGDEAAHVYFSQQGQSTPDFIPYRSFAHVFRAVSAGEVDFGIVPLENSQAGCVGDVYDLLCQYDLFVIGEVCHPVNQCLLCLPGQRLSDITRVISHPQALAQCDTFLRELGVETVATYNTAGSAKMIREEQIQGVAAIASATAAALYELEVLAHNIQTVKENYTRFIVLGREPALRSAGPAKTMLVLTIPHQVGSLYTCLGVLAAHQINLLRLESRPSLQRRWEYIFYLDIEGHREDPPIRSALLELVAHTTSCRVLGSFARNV
jgi:prephenate dehydratase